MWEPVDHQMRRIMNLRILRIPGAISLSAVLLTGSAFAQARPSATASPYGGAVIEEIIARVNDQIITKSDYNRSQNELDQENGAAFFWIAGSRKLRCQSSKMRRCQSSHERSRIPR